jgi:hypothetical protein
MSDMDKKARLAEALRENLRRRKAQARAVRADPAGKDRDGGAPSGEPQD